MSDVSFEFNGLEELMTDFDRCIDKYPDEAEREVYRLGGVWSKDVDAKMPGGYESGKKHLKGNWKRERVKGMSGATVEVEVSNKGRHFHLVENGHEQRYVPEMYAAFAAGRLDSSKGGRKSKSRSDNPRLKNGNFVPGKHYAENTRDEWNNGEYAKHIKKFCDKMLKEHNL